MAPKVCTNPTKKARIACNCKQLCKRARKNPKTSMRLVEHFGLPQMLLQIESSGHSISAGRLTNICIRIIRTALTWFNLHANLHEILDCIWVKFNDLNKARDEASSYGFAGYSLFQIWRADKTQMM